MVSADVFLNLLSLLHSTPLEPANWEHFLREVCALTEARHGFLICSSSNLGLRVLGHGGSEDMRVAQRAYNESSGSLDPFRLPMLLNPRLGVVDGDDLIPPEDFVETPLYQRFLQPMGLRYLTAMSLAVSPRRMEAVSFWRGLDQGPMEPPQRFFLETLLPHVRIALEVRHRLAISEQAACNLQLMLDRTDAAAFLLNAQGRVLHLNRPARTMLEGSQELCLRRARLCAGERTQEVELQRLIGSAGKMRESGGGAMLLPRVAGLGRPLQVIVSPVEEDTRKDSTRTLMVLVTDPDAEVCFPDAVLRGLYRLTPAEAEIANAYLTGYSSEEIALVRGVALSTVRSQLKVLLQKTGTHRQSDLMRLLMTLPRVQKVDAAAAS